MARLLTVYIETRMREGESVKKAIHRVGKLLMGMVGGKAYFLGDKWRISAIDFDGIHGEVDEPCIVPNFNHDSLDIPIRSNEKNGHLGVLRLFGIDAFVIDGYPEFNEVSGVWELEDGTHLIVSGMDVGAGELCFEKRVDLKRLTTF